MIIMLALQMDVPLLLVVPITLLPVMIILLALMTHVMKRQDVSIALFLAMIKITVLLIPAVS
jgi:hypothetical protein